MKRILAFVAVAVLLGLGGRALADAPETTATTSHKMPSSVINDIEVPYEVLEYAQMKYQGYAVIQASRGVKDGQPVYQLHVDNDDILYDDEYIILLYDRQWQLLGEQKTTAVRQPQEQPKTSAPKPQSADDQEEPERPAPNRSRTEPPEQDPPETREPDTPPQPRPERPRRRHEIDW